MPRFGSQSMTGRLERVLVRPPLAEDAERWRDVRLARRARSRRCRSRARALPRHPRGRRRRGRRLASTIAGNPDAIYVYDPVLVGSQGAVLLRPGKEGRRGEPSAIAESLADADVPIAAELAEPVIAEGGDTVWLDEETLLVGIGYRTNPAAVPALADAFPGVDVIAFDLPHWNGRGEVMHLMSFISPLDRDLALVYPRLAPVRLLELLAERGIEIVEVPDEEFETQGPNVLALGPRHALALDGNPETRRRMERAGVDVVVYRGEEISRKGDGGPTCLTRPLLRT